MHHSEAQRGHGEAQSKAVEAHRYQKLAPRFSIASRRAFYSASCWWGGCCEGAAAVQHNAHSLRTVLLLLNTTRTTSGPPQARGALSLCDGAATVQHNARAWSRHAPDPQALDRNVNVQRRAESFRVDMRVSVPAAASMTVVTYMSVPSPSYFSYSCFPLS